MVSRKAVEAVFKESLKLKQGESCLIVTDTLKESIGKAFFDCAKEITKNAKIIVIQPTKEHATEPPKDVAEEMLKYNVQLLITDKSLTHTDARRKACAKGARIGTMPGINEDIANRCLEIDYEDLKRKSNIIHDILARSKKIKVTTKLGTNIDFTVGTSQFFGKDGGSFDYPGAYGNLPEGEVSFAPETCDGVYVVDASFPGLGILKEPITFKVKNCVVQEVSGGVADKVKERLDKVGPKAYKIAELGIGLNPKAEIIGKILEDEKVIGTVHIAVGNDCSYGRKNDIPLHLDGVIRNADIYVDDKQIMKNGKFQGLWKE
ncbi:MAG TPA: aminopeptidase [Candidatus Omnitrophota bacterium]|nr:aminopeptidase [Candidatus Omnitrophota bacterium]HPS19648.1 aminopeptidase [Candidatus Omnitrophota bacterium]